MRFLQRFVVTWAFNLLAIWVAVKLVDGLHYSDWGALVVTALVFALVNMLVKPIVKLLTLPLILLTLGVLLFFINILMLYITDWLVSGFKIDDFMAAVWGTIVIWAVNWALQLFYDVDDRHRGKATARA
jgi:putative membrane protein